MVNVVNALIMYSFMICFAYFCPVFLPVIFMW